MRLNQFLAQAGLGSRRSVEALITSGRVTVDGSVATLQSRIDPASSDVRFDGKSLRLPERPTYIMLNKPAGYTVTRADAHARRQVYQLLPGPLKKLAYVGRLDRESEGLLLFSNDGLLCHRLLLPSFRIEREYKVTVAGEWREELALVLVQGVKFPDGPPLAATRVRTLAMHPGGAELEVVLTEGKKREVRRLCAHVKLEVTRLSRTRLGPIELGNLPPGEHRELSSDEIDALHRLVHLQRK